VAMNMHWEAHDFELPRLPEDARWHVFANTDMKPPQDVVAAGQEVILENQASFLVGARSVVVLIGR
jgi:isoamylase